MRIKKIDGAESATIQTWIVELLHEFDYVLLSPAVGDGLQGIRLDETTGNDGPQKYTKKNISFFFH
jgi:hypothetical protein